MLITQSIDSEGTLDGQVLTSDVATVTSLDISYTSISNIAGIEDFLALVSFDALQIFSLNVVDLSGLSTLEDVNVTFSFNLGSIDLTGCSNLKNLNISFTNVATLDLSTNLLLETINISKVDNIIDLDVSGKNLLNTLIASESGLQNLNVSGCTALSSININETSVQSLDLSGNIAVTSLGFYETYLTTLNLANCTNLTSLTVVGNQDLTNLNLTNCMSLTYLNFRDCTSNDFQLNTDNFPFLEFINFNNAFIPSLDLRNNSNLNTLNLYDCSISELDLRNGNNTNLDVFIIGTNLNCISVDDVNYATNNWPDVFDTVVYSTDCSTLNTDDFQVENLKLYPNPSADYLQISGLQQYVNYSILDVQGKEIQFGTLKPHEKIVINTLHSGLYFLRIDSGTNFKFIKK